MNGVKAVVKRIGKSTATCQFNHVVLMSSVTLCIRIVGVPFRCVFIGELGRHIHVQLQQVESEWLATTTGTKHTTELRDDGWGGGGVGSRRCRRACHHHCTSHR